MGPGSRENKEKKANGVIDLKGCEITKNSNPFF